MSSLEDKRVVVTGAGMGLGAAYAEAAAAAGAIVVVNDVDLGLAAATMKRIEAVGGRAAAFAADVSDWDGAGAVVDHCVREFGGIDGLVNNAGILGRVRPIFEEQADARRAIEINVLGTLYVAAHAAREMVAAGAGGAIVNVSSGAQCGLLMQGTYCASKGAVASYTYTWARDLEEHNIRVNAIAPNAYTAQHDQLIEQVGYNPEANHSAYPSREDNAAVVVYLLSDESEKVNGQVVRVQHGAINLMSQPMIIHPDVSMEEWSVESVAAAFDDGLGEQLQPIGMKVGEVRPLRVVV